MRSDSRVKRTIELISIIGQDIQPADLPLQTHSLRVPNCIPEAGGGNYRSGSEWDTEAVSDYQMQANQ